MNHWLVKTEPETYSWETLVTDKKAVWDGVRNFRARTNLKAMKKGDTVFIYHTGDQKAIMGIGEISREAYPEPADKDWVVVEIEPRKKLKRPVSLAEIKANKKLSDMVLVRVARLSVQPVKQSEFEIIMAMSDKK